MKHLKLILAVVIVGLLTAPQAWTQDEVMILQSKQFNKFQRKHVRFDHSLHESIIQCLVCHHDYNSFDAENIGDGSKCSTCHTKEPNDDVPIGLRAAFHGNCKGCHENYLRWGRDTGPIMCGECHKSGPSL